MRKLLRYAHPEVTYRISHKVLSLLSKGLHLNKDEKAKAEKLTLPSKLFNIRLDIPVGTGAGIDKDGDLAKLYLTLCGFHTVGSILLHPRPGNPHPRLYRYPEALSMINAMGLPSRGISYVIKNLLQIPERYVVIANIAGFTTEEFVILAKVLSRIDCVKVIELNISCPQYKNINLHEPRFLEDLLQRVREVTRKPILVKISPRMHVFLRDIVRVCEKFSNVGLTIANSFPVKAEFMSSGIGGVSGILIYRLMRKLVEIVRKISDIVVVACGGVFYGEQVYELLTRFNVSAVQVVTAIAYEGPFALVRIIRELEAVVESR